MPRYKTKLTGAIVHNTLTNKIELKYYYNDRETTQEENIRLKRQLKKIEAYLRLQLINLSYL